MTPFRYIKTRAAAYRAQYERICDRNRDEMVGGRMLEGVGEIDEEADAEP